jgi:hypothetical protein
MKRLFTTLILIILYAVCLSFPVYSSGEILRKDQQLFSNPNQLLVTEDGKVIDYLSCQRINLQFSDSPIDHQVGTHISRTQRNHLFIAVTHKQQWLFQSTDEGKTWIQLKYDRFKKSTISNLLILNDDSFLGMTGGGEKPLQCYRSLDQGKTWVLISTIDSKPFRIIHVDGDFTQLQDGTILLPVNRRNPPPKGRPWTEHTAVQHIYRSTDGGNTWKGGGSNNFWNTLQQAKLRIEGTSLKSTIPGVGGTFPGCYETQITELANHQLIAAFRYSGVPQPWHKKMELAWGMNTSRQQMIPVVPGVAGDTRILKYIFLGNSSDRGKTWNDFRPILDDDKKSVLWYGSLHGQVVQLPDGRLVLIHVRRYPREDQQVIARVSHDGGYTWGRKAYRLIYGSGYPRSNVLGDGTIVTVSGSTLTTPQGYVPAGGRFSAQVIRWRLPKQEK